jgi:hypothetical protein
MRTINCRIKVNEHQDVAGRGITPAEAVLLRAMHDPTAAKYAKAEAPEQQKKFWGVIVNPIAAEEVTRSNGEEVARLRGKYHQRAKSQAHDSHFIDDIFPGMNPELPETFAEIGLEIAPPAEKAAKTEEPKAEPVVRKTKAQKDAEKAAAKVAAKAAANPPAA